MAEVRTVRVRIAVAVSPAGAWNACGWGPRARQSEDDVMALACDTLGVGEARYWIEANLPVPVAREVVVIPGAVTVEEASDAE